MTISHETPSLVRGRASGGLIWPLSEKWPACGRPSRGPAYLRACARRVALHRMLVMDHEVVETNTSASFMLSMTLKWLQHHKTSMRHSGNCIIMFYFIYLSTFIAHYPRVSSKRFTLILSVSPVGGCSVERHKKKTCGARSLSVLDPSCGTGCLRTWETVRQSKASGAAWGRAYSHSDGLVASFFFIRLPRTLSM
jgi:hypothetical protein